MKNLTNIHLLMERADFQFITSELVKYYGLKSKVKMTSRNRGDYDFDRDIILLNKSYPSVDEFIISIFDFLSSFATNLLIFNSGTD